jgi:hypothetical protein
MKLTLLFVALTLSARAQTINILHIDANATNINGISYDHLWLNAAPVCPGSNYAFETETFTWFGEPQWNAIGQFTPQYLSDGTDVWVTNGGAHFFRTRLLIPPTK